MNTEHRQQINEVRRDDETNEKTEQELHLGRSFGDAIRRRRYLINILFVLYGMVAPIGLNAICSELPLLVKLAPEGSQLLSSQGIAIVAAYTGPALYSLFKKSSPVIKTRNECIWISSALILSTIGIVLLAFFHNVTITFKGIEHSFVMLIFVFVLALVAGLRNILIMPYLRHFQEAHINTFFIGEGLSGFIPSIIALIQGIGDDPICPRNSTNFTDQSAPYVLPPKFSSRAFFLCVASIQMICVCAFWCLEYIRIQISQKRKNAKFCENEMRELNSYKKILDDESEERNLEIEIKTVGESTPSKSTDPTKRRIGKIERIYLYVLIWIVYLAAHGFLNNMEVFSSRPYGNSAYHLVANLSQLAGTMICIVAFWFPPVGTRGITWIMSFVCIGTAYVVWLASSSPMPIWRDTTHGVILLVIIWILLMSLVSLAKLTITAVIWEESKAEGLYRLNFANLFGSSCSAGISFGLVYFTDLFTPYEPCQTYQQ